MLLRSALLPVLSLTLCAATDDLYKSAENTLNEALTQRNPDTRKRAAAALSLAASREPWISRLTATLQDKDAEVRLAAVSSLSEVKNKSVAAELAKLLDDPVPEVGFAAAKALWTLRDPAGQRALMAVVSGETKASSSFLSRQKREALRMMNTPKTALMFAARTGAGFAPVPGLGSGISSMQAILSDPEVSGRAAAALLLAQRNNPAILQALKQALTEKDASLRAAAVHALALTNNRSHRKDIAPLIKDESEPVRLRAAAAYLRLSPAPAGRGGPASAPRVMTMKK